MLFFFLFRKSISDVFQTFALINKQVANQPIEICFSKGDEKKRKKKKCFRKFIPSFVSSDTTSKPLCQTDSPWNGWCLSFCLFFFVVSFWLFIFVVLWQDYLSSVRKDLTYPKQPQLTKSSLWSRFSSRDSAEFILPFLRGGCFSSQLCLWYPS